jgi:cytochrome c oxidase subunit IV
MEANPTPPPGEKKPLLWPIVVNLAALVGLAVYFGSNAAAISSAILALVILNLCAALLMSRFKRLNWAIAFLLSALLLPLIGFGLCAAFIAANGGLHGGN